MDKGTGGAVAGDAAEDIGEGMEQQEQDPQGAPAGAEAPQGAQDSEAARPTETSEEPADESVEEPDEDAGPDGAGSELSDEELLDSATALVFASPEPLSTARIRRLLDSPPRARVEAALKTLEERLEASGLPLRLRGVAGGWTVTTAPEVSETVAKLAKTRRTERVSPAALETLAVVAYRQPVSKAEIEAIRGVQAGPILRSLVDRGLVRVVGRADVPGHPLQYGTTRDFLDRFGLMSLGDLPRDAELTRD